MLVTPTIVTSRSQASGDTGFRIWLTEFNARHTRKLIAFGWCVSQNAMASLPVARGENQCAEMTLKFDIQTHSACILVFTNQ